MGGLGGGGAHCAPEQLTFLPAGAKSYQSFVCVCVMETFEKSVFSLMQES